MNLTEAELQKLDNCKSEREWNNTCDEIKRARSGQYPPDWYQKMIMSGRVNSIRAKNNW